MGDQTRLDFTKPDQTSYDFLFLCSNWTDVNNNNIKKRVILKIDVITLKE